jgi:hypothetical protein
MAHADNSALMRKLRGLLGKELVFRDWAGKTVVSKAPKKRTAPSSPEQAATNVKFLLASRYAKAIILSNSVCKKFPKPPKIAFVGADVQFFKRQYVMQTFGLWPF